MAKKKEGESLLSTGIGGGSKRAPKYPDKTTINLVRFQTEKSASKDILIILLIAVVLIAFGKFAVFDQLNRIQEAQRIHAIKQEELQTLKQQNASFEQVKEEYDRVTEWYMTEAEKAIIDKMDVLAMLEDDLKPYVEVKSISVNGTTISIQAGQTTMETVSEFLLRLQMDPRNRTATVTTTSAAGSSQSGTAMVTSTIIIDFIGGSSAEAPAGTESTPAAAAAGAESAPAAAATAENGGEA